jgi:hypothetical protein
MLACASLLFPNVFTPNGDQHNETFTIQYEGNDFGMRIYNRRGRLVPRRPMACMAVF